MTGLSWMIHFSTLWPSYHNCLLYTSLLPLGLMQLSVKLGIFPSILHTATKWHISYASSVDCGCKINRICWRQHRARECESTLNVECWTLGVISAHFITDKPKLSISVISRTSTVIKYSSRDTVSHIFSSSIINTPTNVQTGFRTFTIRRPWIF